MQLFKFFHTENTSKQQKMVDFVSNCLEENDFETVLVNFCCYEYGANASEAVQKKSLAQGHCWSYAISLKHLIL